MEDAQIPSDVAALVRERIHSVEQLEVLLALHADPARVCSVDELARAIRATPAFVEPALAELVTRGLVDAGTPDAYRIAVLDEPLRSTVAALAACYESHRLELLVMISKHAISRVRNEALHTFAEAFRVRGRKEDG